jgi:NADH-quinone oxidoreductase subunit G
MEGFQGKPPAPLIPRFWAPRWNSIQSLNKFQSEVAGTLTWESEKVGVFSDSRQIDTEYKPVKVIQHTKQDDQLLLPINEIFGTEELSGNSQSIKERIPQPYIAVSWVDAHKLEIKDQDRIRVLISDQIFELTAKVREEIPSGVCGLPMGLPATPFFDLPCFCAIQKISGDS